MASPRQLGTRSLNVEVVVVGGGTQGTATQVPVKSAPALIVAAGDGVGGILLPPASKGAHFYVKNTGAATNGFMGILNVYPATGDAVNALAVNSPLQMAALTAAIFVAKDSTTWYTFSLLPS